MGEQQDSCYDRANLEWLVFFALTQEEPIISISRGRELLGFTCMEEMREWMQEKRAEGRREMELIINVKESDKTRIKEAAKRIIGRTKSIGFDVEADGKEGTQAL